MEAHDVIKRAKAWVTDIYAEEGIQNLGLEEIDYDEDERAWNVTLGFSRPWNTARNAITAITGEPVARRTSGCNWAHIPWAGSCLSRLERRCRIQSDIARRVTSRTAIDNRR